MSLVHERPFKTKIWGLILNPLNYKRKRFYCCLKDNLYSDRSFISVVNPAAGALNSSQKLVALVMKELIY